MSKSRGRCQGNEHHSPEPAEVDRHHVRPHFLCSLLGLPARRETVLLCSGCHDLLHHVLRHLINEGDMGGHRLSIGLRAWLLEGWRWYREALLT